MAVASSHGRQLLARRRCAPRRTRAEQRHPREKAQRIHEPNRKYYTNIRLGLDPPFPPCELAGQRVSRRARPESPAPPVELDGLGATWLERIAALARSQNFDYTCASLPSHIIDRRVQVDGDGPLHAQIALSTVHPYRKRWDLDATLRFAIKALAKWGSETQRLRRYILAVIKQKRGDLKDEFDEWYRGLLPEV